MLLFDVGIITTIIVFYYISNKKLREKLIVILSVELVSNIKKLKIIVIELITMIFLL